MKDKNVENKLEEVMDEFTNDVDYKKVLANNTLLRKRILDLVDVTKEALQPK